MPIGSNDIFNFWVKFSYRDIIFHINIATYQSLYQTSHDPITMLLSIKINDHLWSEQERNNIISEAVDLYMSVPKKKRVDTQETGCQEKVN